MSPVSCLVLVLFLAVVAVPTSCVKQVFELVGPDSVSQRWTRHRDYDRTRFARDAEEFVSRNDDLERDLEINGTWARNDTHNYYESSYVLDGAAYVVNFDIMKNNPDVSVYKSPLSNGHNQAQIVTLNFSFPFYGHMVRSVAVTAAGFIHIGPQIHEYMRSTHYVAPLMTDFNPSLGDDASVHYLFTKNSFTVQWTNMSLNGGNAAEKATFQVSLYDTGKIVFAYMDIGITPASLRKTNLTRVGLSDGFIMTYEYFGRRHLLVVHNFIYSYHTVSLSVDSVKSYSAFVLTPLPNCITFTSCESCLTSNTTFQCKWCPQLQRCSDSFDWHRQSWIRGNCIADALNTYDLDKCKALSLKPVVHGLSLGSSMPVGHVIGIVVAILFGMLLIVVVAFLLYAYRHPTSKSGMWLVEHRPTRVMASFKRLPDEEML